MWKCPRWMAWRFWKNSCTYTPCRVIMISSLTERSAEVTLKALALGAVDFVTKPKLNIANDMQEYGELIVDKIRVAAKAKLKKPPD